MPLPFLKPKAVAGVIIARRKPDGAQETEGMEDQPNEGLMMAAADLIRAVHAKDESAVADALQAAFELMEEQPHEEGPHVNEEEEQGE
jgi:hypothetical protein